MLPTIPLIFGARSLTCKICKGLSLTCKTCKSLPTLVKPLSPTFLLQNLLHCWSEKRVSVVLGVTFRVSSLVYSVVLLKCGDLLLERVRGRTTHEGGEKCWNRTIGNGTAGKRARKQWRTGGAADSRQSSFGCNAVSAVDAEGAGPGGLKGTEAQLEASTKKSHGAPATSLH